MKLLTVLIFIAIPLMNNSTGRGSEKISDTDQNQKPVISFGIIADVQYTDAEPAGSRYYRSSVSKLKEAVNSFVKDSVDFVITLGDLIDRELKSYDTLLNIMESSGLRFYHITGNHDFSVDYALKNSLPAVYFKLPGYYSFSENRYRFIFLNGNEVSTYSSNNRESIKKAELLLDSLKKRGEQNAVDWNGGISIKQLAWLNEQLFDATNKNEKVFIICHFPVYPDNIHNLLNYRDVLPVLGKYQNIIAWFNGHNHKGNYGILNSTHFVTFKGMVETDDQNSFARIDVYSNEIRIAGSGREKSEVLTH